MIKISAPGKIHLLGEHAVVYGKPALLAAVDLRVTVHLRGEKMRLHLGGGANLAKIIEPIIKKQLKIKQIPPYKLEISSQIPVGAGLGSSAAVSAACIAALLSFLKVKWDLELINRLAFEAEKVFHGNPSGGDNTAVVYGGLIWYQKNKGVQPLKFPISPRLTRNFILINTGKPKETTKQMVEMVAEKSSLRRQSYGASATRFKKIFDDQEQLVKELVTVLKDGNEMKLIQIIKAGERNLEAIGVVSPSVKSIIRKIENAGGAAKICGAGGKTKATGVLLAYYKDGKELEKIAKSLNLPFFKVALGVEGLKNEN